MMKKPEITLIFRLFSFQHGARQTIPTHLFGGLSGGPSYVPDKKSTD